ncbi:HlyC/CorC family transporter [Azovibrio restrictus]|uniref:HlyC/CorC family transporter n=1 Tax=Azovibrio restrictus TaxID=146938 RepID=UPI00040579E8|nr:CNNM domain-containing protein [Azovibrio restrictus]
MEQIPLSVLVTILVILLALSAFFSLSETAMMAANRYKLRHRAQQGHLGAKLALALLAQTDRLLGVILLGNNLVNTGAATLVSLITIELFGNDKWILGMATLLVTFAILVFSEITPKIIGATHADRISQVLGYIFTPLIRIFYPAIWFVNLFVGALLRLLRLSRHATAEAPKLTPEELRTLVMESRELIPPTHSTILVNLFDLGKIAVEDVMTPRGAIEILDLDAPREELQNRIATSQHLRLPVCRESLDQLLGVLPIRRVTPHLHDLDFSEKELRQQLLPPYYIPAGTPLFAQLGFFQENRQRLGFVVDEYGEILGLLTLEDIIEEIVGEFSSSVAGAPHELTWDDEGCIMVEGSTPLRDLNRKLDLHFPLDGPKTLNGLILEHFEDIPEAGVSFKLHGIAVEIIQTQDRSVKTARIQRLSGP